MSVHFKWSLKLLTALSVLLLAIFLWLKHQLTAGPGMTKPPAVLPTKDKALVTFNEKTHVLTVQTATKTVTEYAKNPTVEILKNGDVAVQRHLAGFESEWFLGAGYSNTGRLFFGDNVFHFSRFDVFGAIGWSPDNRFNAVGLYGGLGYNVYHNTSINLAINPLSVVKPTPEIAGFISIRF